jgi:pimeloyl-ACP methyl ester carboxylesterase
VLVGHSSGAITVQLYAYTFPQEVSGLVLVDGSTENETARLDRITGGKYSQSMTGFAALAMTCRDAAQIGALAPGNEHFDDCLSAAPITGLGHALAAAIRGAASLPAQRDALVSELANDPVSAAQLRAARNSFGDLPVACLTRSVPLFTPPGTRQSPASVAAERENKAMHDEIAALSRRGSNRVVPGAGHFIQTDRPQAVIPAIDRVLAEQ